MVTNNKKLAVNKATKKPVAKKNAVKKPIKKVPKKAAKKAVKKTVKKAVKKVAGKKAVKTVVKKVAVKKVVPKKAAAKKTLKVVKPTPASRTVAVTPKIPPTSPAPSPKVASAPVSSTPAVSLKGLRGVSGAKAARIAQIVAESFLSKPTVAKPAAPSASLGERTQTSTDEPGSALDAAHKAAAVLFSKKAEDVVLMDLRNLSTVADYYLIATCQNEPQMRSILGTVQRTLSRDGIKSLRSEYMPGVRWAVVDYGDMILHLFEKQTRGFYSLERLWADAPSTPLKASDYALPADADDGIDADEDGDL